MNASDVARTVMRILVDSDGYPLSEDVLREHVKARLRSVQSLVVDDVLEMLSTGGYIAQRPGEFGDGVKWLITEKGEAWLAR